MTHPISDVVVGTAVALAIGAGTFLFIPPPKPAPASDLKRLDALSSQLQAITVEHRKLAEEVEALRAARRTEVAR